MVLIFQKLQALAFVQDYIPEKRNKPHKKTEKL